MACADINETNFHRTVWLAESEQTSGDIAWFVYVRDVERHAGLKPNSLDGDDGCGLSLDYAYEAFRDGTTALEYVKQNQKVPA